jgi:hypothetical protein
LPTAKLAGREHCEGVTTAYFRMSSTGTVEAARQRLIQEPYQSPTRVLGDANRLILCVDYRPGYPPDPIIRRIDPMARRIASPPPEATAEDGPDIKKPADPTPKP